MEADWIEGVILLPENLFYNTTAPGIILLLNKAKPAACRGQILLVNVSNFFVKEKPKNALTEEGIAAVVEVYRTVETREKLSRVITLAEACEADYNLSPLLFVENTDKTLHRSLVSIRDDLDVALAEPEQADPALTALLEQLGVLRMNQVTDASLPARWREGRAA